MQPTAVARKKKRKLNEVESAEVTTSAPKKKKKTKISDATVACVNETAGATMQVDQEATPLPHPCISATSALKKKRKKSKEIKAQVAVPPGRPGEEAIAQPEDGQATPAPQKKSQKSNEASAARAHETTEATMQGGEAGATPSEGQATSAPKKKRKKSKETNRAEVRGTSEANARA